jgi:hypothetical protein
VFPIDAAAVPPPRRHPAAGGRVPRRERVSGGALSPRRAALVAHSWRATFASSRTRSSAAILSDGAVVEVENLRLGTDSTPPVALADVVDLGDAGGGCSASASAEQKPSRAQCSRPTATVGRRKSSSGCVTALNRRLRRESQPKPHRDARIAGSNPSMSVSPSRLSGRS